LRRIATGWSAVQASVRVARAAPIPVILVSCYLLADKQITFGRGNQYGVFGIGRRREGKGEGPTPANPLNCCTRP
jgi:hypothetical protein